MKKGAILKDFDTIRWYANMKGSLVIYQNHRPQREIDVPRSDHLFHDLSFAVGLARWLSAYSGKIWHVSWSKKVSGRPAITICRTAGSVSKWELDTMLRTNTQNITHVNHGSANALLIYKGEVYEFVLDARTLLGKSHQGNLSLLWRQTQNIAALNKGASLGLILTQPAF